MEEVGSGMLMDSITSFDSLVLVSTTFLNSKAVRIGASLAYPMEVRLIKSKNRTTPGNPFDENLRIILYRSIVIRAYFLWTTVSYLLFADSNSQRLLSSGDSLAGSTIFQKNKRKNVYAYVNSILMGYIDPSGLLG